MMGKTLWQGLKRLVEYDNNLIRITSEMKNYQKRKDTALEQVMLHCNKKGELEAFIAQAKRDIGLQELHIKQMRVDEQQTQEKIDAISDEKSYKALERELYGIVEKRKYAEDGLLALYEQCEVLEKKYTHAVAVCSEKQRTVQVDIDAYDKEIARRMKDIEHYELDRATLYKQLPEEWTVKYDRMRARVSDPIVPVVNNCCSSCYYSVLHQDAVKLKHNMIVVCRSCYRLLYLDEQEVCDLQKACF